MKIDKKKFVRSLLSVLILLFMMISVKANNANTTEYNLELIGMNIQLDKNLIDMVSGIENGDERIKNVEDKEGYKQSYEQIGVLLDALDNIEKGQQNKEILVVAQTNSVYATMQNLSEFSDEDANKYLKQFIQSMEKEAETSEFEVIKTELIKSNNGNKYINVISTAQVEEKTVNMSIYYTIMNGNFITLSFRYYGENEQPRNEQEQQVVEQIQFYEVKRPNYATTNETAKIALGITFIIAIILVIVVIIIRIKDRRQLNKNASKYIKQYSKFGGLLLFFWSMCFYQILLNIINIDDANKIENMVFYTISLKVQNLILLLIAVYQIYIILKRKDSTPRKIIKSNIIIIIINCSITLIRIMYEFISGSQLYHEIYFEQEVTMLPYNIIYPLMCIIYYTMSKRVQIYYRLPEKGYKQILKEIKDKIKSIKKGELKNEKK